MSRSHRLILNRDGFLEEQSGHFLLGLNWESNVTRESFFLTLILYLIESTPYKQKDGNSEDTRP